MARRESSSEFLYNFRISKPVGDQPPFVEPLAQGAISPDPARRAIYQELIDVYAACEAHALGQGRDPSPRLAEFAAARED